MFQNEAVIGRPDMEWEGRKDMLPRSVGKSIASIMPSSKHKGQSWSSSRALIVELPKNVVDNLLNAEYEPKLSRSRRESTFLPIHHNQQRNNQCSV